MLISEILNEDSPIKLGEASRPIVAIYPGRFSPPHIGHMKAWQWLNDKYGKAFIATSDKVAPPKSPFNFNEKKRLFMHAGVPTDAIVQVRNPYMASEIIDRYDPEKITVIFAVSKKDMDEDPRFAFKPKKDGSPGYLQPWEANQGNPEPASVHGYVATVPTFKFNVNGKPMKSATEFRANFANADESTQARMIEDLYGKYSEEVHQLMRDKIVQ